MRSGMITARELFNRVDRDEKRGPAFQKRAPRPRTFGEELLDDFKKNMRTHTNPRLRGLYADDDGFDYFEKVDVEDDEGVGEAAIKAKLKRRDDLKNEVATRLFAAKDKIGIGPLSEEQRDAWIAEHPADRRLADADIDAKIAAASRADDAGLIRELGLLEVEIAGWPEEIGKMEKRAQREAYMRSPASRAAARRLDEDLYPQRAAYLAKGRGYVCSTFAERAARTDLAHDIAEQERIRDIPPFWNRERIA